MGTIHKVLVLAAMMALGAFAACDRDDDAAAREEALEAREEIGQRLARLAR